MRINWTGVKDNLQHMVGNVVGLTYLKTTGKRFTKEQRGAHWFSTVAANIAASELVETIWLPYTMIV
jgi:hypothetical protein